MIERPKKILIITNDKIFTPLASIEIIFSEPSTHIYQFKSADAVFQDLSVADCLDLVVYHLPTADPDKEIGKAMSFLESFNRLFPNSPFPDIIFSSAKIGVAEEAKNRTYSIMRESPAGLRNISGVAAIDRKEISYITALIVVGKVTNPDFIFPLELYDFLRVTYNYPFPSFEDKFSLFSPSDQKEIARQIKLVEDGIAERNPDGVRQSERPDPVTPKSSGEPPKP